MCSMVNFKITPPTNTYLDLALIVIDTCPQLLDIFSSVVDARASVHLQEIFLPVSTSCVAETNFCGECFYCLSLETANPD